MSTKVECWRGGSPPPAFDSTKPPYAHAVYTIRYMLYEVPYGM